VLSFYVKAGSEASINNAPEGTFTIEFATGREFSQVCGYFLSDMTSSRTLPRFSFAQTEWKLCHQFGKVAPRVPGAASASWNHQVSDALMVSMAPPPQ
jgi:hypothetical protein